MTYFYEKWPLPQFQAHVDRVLRGLVAVPNGIEDKPSRIKNMLVVQSWTSWQMLEVIRTPILANVDRLCRHVAILAFPNMIVD